MALANTLVSLVFAYTHCVDASNRLCHPDKVIQRFNATAHFPQPPQILNPMACVVLSIRSPMPISSLMRNTPGASVRRGQSGPFNYRFIDQADSRVASAFVRSINGVSFPKSRGRMNSSSRGINESLKKPGLYRKFLESEGRAQTRR
jgi:hypothetical protein